MFSLTKWNSSCQRKPSGFPMHRLRVPKWWLVSMQWPFYCSWMWPGLFADSNSGNLNFVRISMPLWLWRSWNDSPSPVGLEESGFSVLFAPFRVLRKVLLKCYQESSWYEISIMVLKLLRKICSAFSPVRNSANLLRNVIHSDSQGRMSASGSYF